MKIIIITNLNTFYTLFSLLLSLMIDNSFCSYRNIYQQQTTKCGIKGSNNGFNNNTNTNSFLDNYHHHQLGIINGQNAAKHEFPWQGALFYKNSFICGCSVLSKEWIITAAHCAVSNNPKSFQIVLSKCDHDEEDNL